MHAVTIHHVHASCIIGVVSFIMYHVCSNIHHVSCIMNRACCEAFIMYYSACVICVVAFIKKTIAYSIELGYTVTLDLGCSRSLARSFARSLGHSHGHSHGRTVWPESLVKKKLVEAILTLRPPTFHSVVIISVLFLQYYCCVVHNTWLLFGHNIVLNVLFTLL